MKFRKGDDLDSKENILGVLVLDVLFLFKKQQNRQCILELDTLAIFYLSSTVKEDG